MKENLSRMWRSGLSLLLALVLVVGMCPITAFATEGTSTTELEAKIDELMATVKQYAPQVADRLYDYVVEHGYIDTVNATFEELNAKVDEITTEYENEDAAVFQKAIEMLNEQIALLEEQIPTLQEAGVDTADIEAQIVTLEANAETLQKGLDAADAAMKGLKDSLTAVETAVDTMVGEMKNPNGESIDEIKASLKATKDTVEATLKDLKAAAEQVPTVLDNLADLGIDAYKQVSECVDFVLADIQAVFDNLQAENNDEYESQVSKIIETLETEKAAIESQLLADVEALYAKYDAKIAEANADLNATLAEMEAKIDEAQKDLKAEAERLQAEKDRLEGVKAELEAEKERLEGVKAELEAEKTRLEGVKADLEAQADALEAEIEKVKAEIDASTDPAELEALKAELEAKKADLEAQADQAKADADAAKAKADQAQADADAAKAKADQAQADADKAQADFEAVKAEMDQIRADLEAQYKEAIEGLEATANAMVEELKADLAAEEKVLRDIAAEEKAKLEEAANKAIEEAKKVAGIWDNEVTRAALEKAKEIAVAIKEAVKGETGSSIENADEVVAGAKEAVATLKEEVKALIEEIKALYYDATHEPYTKYCYSAYAALGEDNAAADSSYADIVAARVGENGFSAKKYDNVAVADVSITDYYAQVENNKADIAAADLITVDFSSNIFLRDAVAQMSAASAPDWAAYVGETGENAILEALAVVNKLLEEAGIGTGTLKYLIEGYAYSYVSYVYHLPYILNEIHEINPDAVVLTVGMHNSLEGVSLNINGKTLPLGKCVGILVDGANAYSTAYAMVTNKTSHVNATEVEVLGANAAYSVNEMLLNVAGDTGYFEPTTNGQTYIADQILLALEIDATHENHVYENGVCTICGHMPIYRLAGVGRYVTATEIADDMKEELGMAADDKFQTVIVASGDNFPDALAGSYLATVTNAPILLTAQAGTQWTRNYIKNNLVAGGTIYMLGSNKAISDEYATTLSAYGKVVRLEGENRWETCVAILNEAAKYDPNPTEVLVCSGMDENSVDALTASSVGKPILLINGKGNKLQPYQEAYLKGKNFVIIGDENAVNAKQTENLKAVGKYVTTLGGIHRVDTSLKVAKYFFPNAEFIAMARGDDFPDALCAGPLANLKGAPVILATPYSTQKQLNADYVAEMRVDEGFVAGGDNVVADELAAFIFGLPEDSVIPVK